jgi:SAM-dependent methyltransferase
VDDTPNICAGPFGAFYDFYIERAWLMRWIGRAVWGIDASVLYASMEPISRVPGGATILDVPCGGGVAFRNLRPDQDVNYVAGDLSEKMLTRAQRRARARSHSFEPGYATCASTTCAITRTAGLCALSSCLGW